MPRILIADDDPISLRYLDAALTQMGCDVVAVADGTSALAQAQARPFDLLLLDRRMPDLGGAELLAALRQHGVAAVAVATSAQVDAAIVSQLRGAGFAGVIAKPATVAELELGLSPHLHFCATARSAIEAPPATRLLDDEAALAAIGGDVDALQRYARCWRRNCPHCTRNCKIRVRTLPSPQCASVCTACAHPADFAVPPRWPRQRRGWIAACATIRRTCKPCFPIF